MKNPKKTYRPIELEELEELEEVAKSILSRREMSEIPVGGLHWVKHHSGWEGLVCINHEERTISGISANATGSMAEVGGGITEDASFFYEYLENNGFDKVFKEHKFLGDGSTLWNLLQILKDGDKEEGGSFKLGDKVRAREPAEGWGYIGVIGNMPMPKVAEGAVVRIGPRDGDGPYGPYVDFGAHGAWWIPERYLTKC